MVIITDVIMQVLWFLCSQEHPSLDLCWSWWGPSSGPDFLTWLWPKFGPDLILVRLLLLCWCRSVRRTHQSLHPCAVAHDLSQQLYYGQWIGSPWLMRAWNQTSHIIAWSLTLRRPYDLEMALLLKCLPRSKWRAPYIPLLFTLINTKNRMIDMYWVEPALLRTYS